MSNGHRKSCGVFLSVVARVRALCAFKKHAQDGRGVKRPPEELRSVSSLLLARVRALCAFENHAQDGRAGKRPAQGRMLWSPSWPRAAAPIALLETRARRPQCQAATGRAAECSFSPGGAHPRPLRFCAALSRQHVLQTSHVRMDAPIFERVAKETQQLAQNYRLSIMRVQLEALWGRKRQYCAELLKATSFYEASFYDWAGA